MSARATVELQAVSKVIAGGKSGQTGNDFVDGGYPAYGAGGVNGYLDSFEYDGDAVILSSIGARCGKAFYPQGKWSSLANTQLIFPNPNRVDRRFLWYQINDEDRWHRSGTAQPYIKPSDIKTSRVFLPPLPEQRRIAAILDQADELRTKSRRALELLDELADSLFVDMFGSLDNSIGEPAALIELGRVVTGKTPPSASEGMFGDFVPFVTPGDLGRELTLGRGLSQSGAAMVPLVASGSLLVCCIGATIGKIGMATEMSAFNQQINAVEWGPRVDPTFGLFAVRQRREEIVNRASSTTMPILNKGHFQKIQIAIPEIDRQRSFAKKIAVLTDQKSKSQSADVNLDELSASLHHRAFRGEL